MKFRSALILIMCFHAGIFCYAQKQTFQIRILQGNNVITPGFTNEVVLKKEAFKIQVMLNKLDGVYLYAAFKDSVYKISPTDSIPGYNEIPPMVMAENSFNDEEELLISDDGWAYWFYDPKQDWHRFDKNVNIEGDVVTGTKTIKQFYDVASGKQIPVRDVTGPLYLFFFSAQHDKANNIATELQRYKIKINWN